MFDHLIGNEPIKNYLRRALLQNELSHCLLFSGLSGVGKFLFAKELSKHLLNSDPKRIEEETHPDFHVFRPESKSALHTIDSLRKLIQEVHLASFESNGKVFVIQEADRMQPAAANALLKTLEEPALDTTIILIAENGQDLLPTIRSRSALLNFKAISEEEMIPFLKEKNLPEHLAKVSNGSIGQLLEFDLREKLEEAYLPLLREDYAYPELVQKIEEIEKLVDSEEPLKKMRNVNYLFHLHLIWHRDQVARRLKVSNEDLFLPLEKLSSKRLLPLSKILLKVQDTHLAFQRNIKLSTCLEELIQF